MRLKRSIFISINLLVVAVLVLFTWANSNQDYSLGRSNFFKVTQYIHERYDEKVDLADLYEEAWTSLSEILPVTGEILASPDVSSGSEEAKLLYASKIEKAISLAHRKQAQDATPTVREMWNQTIGGMVAGLDDQFSQYLPPVEHKELQRVLSGEPDENKQFYGVGISVEWDIQGDKGVLVITPLPDTPAEKNGIRSGDIIIGVNGEMFKDWKGSYGEKLKKAIDKIKGEKDTEVTLTIKKPHSPEPVDVVLKRAPINEEQHIYKEMLDDEVGSVRLRSFYANAANDLLEALRYLKLSGMEKLVLDLRFDPGGYLDQAIRVADIFLDKGSLITYTQGRKSRRHDFIDGNKSKDGFDTIPMVILMNQWSASASEVVTGALKDNERAVVIGNTSFGKGSVQEVFELYGGAGLRLTVAKYYTPSGNCIHDVGITPDIEVDPLTQEDGEWLEDKEYFHVPRLERILDFDPQLKVAYQYLKGEITL